MKMTRLMVIVFILVFINGCSFGHETPPTSNFSIIVPTPTMMESFIGKSLKIEYVRSVEPFNSNQMVYRLENLRFEKDPYNRFISDPEVIIANQAVTWFERSGLFQTVIPPEVNTPTDSVLQILVTNLYGDFRDNQTAAAVVEMQFVLVKEINLRPQPVLIKKIASRVELTQRDPAALVQGYGKAMSEIFHKLSSEMINSLAKPSTTTSNK